MEGVIQNLHTLEDLHKWSVMWGMEDDNLILERRAQILREMTDVHTPVLPENVL